MMIKFILFIPFLFFHNLVISQSSLYIYTNKNLLPGDELKVNASGYNIYSDEIIFVVYRVKNPLNLAQAQFDFFNFNDKNFNELSDNFDLVNSYQRNIKTKISWFSETFTLGKIEAKGTYLIRALVEDKSFYTFFNCSELGIISKRSVDEVLVFVSNRKNSHPIPNSEVKLISIDKKIYSLVTNKDGIALKTIGDRPEDRRFFIVATDDDTSFIMQEVIYSPSDEYDRYLVYTYTNQPVYRPKQKMFFKSIVRERKYDELTTPKRLEVRVKVLMPDNSKLYDSILITSSFGTLNGSVEIPDHAPLGPYLIVIEISGISYPTTFYVEEYKKPEYKVTVKTNKENYSLGETVEIKVTADYFFGKPVQFGKVKLLIYRKPLIKHWWEFEQFADFYRGCFVDIIPDYPPELLIEEGGDIKNGWFEYSFKIDSNIDRNYEYQVVAYVKDETNREVQGVYKFKVLKNKINVTTSADKHFYTSNSNIILKVVTTDFSFNPLKKKFLIIIQRVHTINFADYYEDVDTLHGETQKDGIGFVHYKTSVSGKYAYTVIVEHEDKKLTARGEFLVSDKELKISGIREGLQIIPAKDVFNNSDELEFLIISVFKDVNIFVTLEQSKFYDYRIIKLDGHSTIVKFNKELPSVTHISAGFYFDNQYLSYMKKFGILNNKKKINIEISTDKEIYKPGEKGRFKIKVFDHQGKPIRNAELSSSIIDESIFSIKPEQSENIFEAIAQSTIYKILTTTTELPIFFMDRNFYDQQITQFKELKKKGRTILSGKVINAISGEPISSAEIKLIKDDQQIVTSTNTNGEFVFLKIPEGNYDLIVDIPHFYKKIIPSINISPKSTFKSFTISLIPVEIYSLYSQESLITKEGIIFSKGLNERITPELMFEKINRMEDHFIEPTIRKDFKDAIYWNANLVTDLNGEAKIEVIYPDNLTSWRNSIKAITIDSKAGENYTNVIVRKDIMVRVETPRYVHEKDEISLPVMVHNYSSTEQKVKVQLIIENGKMISSSIKERINQRIMNPDEVTIKSNDVVKLNFNIKVDENVDTLFIIAKALVRQLGETNVESDAVEIKVPIESIGYPEFVVNNFSLSKAKEKISARIYASDEKRNLKIILKLSPTLIANILSSIDELVAYPYGCVEQTMSRFLPAIIVANLIKELKLDIKQKTLEELPKVISEGLKRLKDFQNTNGGWGWWKDDQTNSFMTAYVMYGLSLTKKAGYNVDDVMFKNGLKVLRNLVMEKNENSGVSAYLLYSFNEAISFDENFLPDREILKNKFDDLKKNENEPYILALLLEIAIKNGFNNDIKKLKANLLKTAVVEGNLVFWGKNDFYHRHFISDPIEITSSAIRSLIMSGERSNLIENGIRWLVNQKKGSFWLSTKQTASAIFSIAEYIRTSDELSANFTVKLKLNGKEIRSWKFDQKTLKSGELSFTILPSEMKMGLNEIEIEKSGTGKLYFSLIEKFFKRSLERSENIFEVERKFFVIKYEKDGDRIIRKISRLKGEVKVGERILVELKVRSKNNYEYFMIEDPIVPGFERINDQFEQDFANRWFYHFKEERDKQTTFFVTYFNKGEYTFHYTTYAQIPGIYTLPPAVASLMYYPDLRGIGEESVIKIID